MEYKKSCGKVESGVPGAVYMDGGETGLAYMDVSWVSHLVLPISNWTAVDCVHEFTFFFIFFEFEFTPLFFSFFLCVHEL